jgi:superfamily II DNA or RNA helicase
LSEAYTSEGDKIEIRDYQLESVYKALKNKRGIILQATGGGKSLGLYILIKSILVQKSDRKICIICRESIGVYSERNHRRYRKSRKNVF